MKQNQTIRETPKGYSLSPGKKLPNEMLEKLEQINHTYSVHKHFPEYQNAICQLFQLKSIHINEKARFFLAGFLEGEGSINVGAKKNATSRFKVYVDPEFSVTQHVNGVSNLYLAMCYFQTGRIRYKSNSNATLVYTIDNRQNLKEKVIPFYEKWIRPYGSLSKVKRTQTFKKLLQLFDEKAHLDFNRMMHEVLPLWNQLRIQVGQTNQAFESLEEAQRYVKFHFESNSSFSFQNPILKEQDSNSKGNSEK